MTPTTAEALLLLVGFVLPGFVTQAIAERTHVRGRKFDGFERLLWALYYSTWVYFLFGLIVALTASAHGGRVTLQTLRDEAGTDHAIGAVALVEVRRS